MRKDREGSIELLNLLEERKDFYAQLTHSDLTVRDFFLTFTSLCRRVKRLEARIDALAAMETRMEEGY